MLHLGNRIIGRNKYTQNSMFFLQPDHVFLISVAIISCTTRRYSFRFRDFLLIEKWHPKEHPSICAFLKPLVALLLLLEATWISGFYQNISQQGSKCLYEQYTNAYFSLFYPFLWNFTFRRQKKIWSLWFVFYPLTCCTS